MCDFDFFALEAVEAAAQRGLSRGRPLAGTSWIPLLPHLWETRMPQLHRPAARLSFDEWGQGLMADTAWGTQRIWTETEEAGASSSNSCSGELCVVFGVRVLTSLGREDDSGTARVSVEEPGWMLARFDMRCGSRGFYLFSRSDLNLDAGDPAFLARLRPLFVSAWSGVPADVRPHLGLDFTPDGRGSGGCGTWHFTLEAQGEGNEEILGQGAHFTLKMEQRMSKLAFPIFSTALVRGWRAGLLVVEAPGATPVRMLFACGAEGLGPKPHPAESDEKPASWGAVTFWLEKDVVSLLTEVRLAPHSSQSLPAQRAPADDAWFAQLPPTIADPLPRSFLQNTMLVGSELQMRWKAEAWWKEAICQAERQLWSCHARARLWSLLLMAATARCTPEPRAAVALAIVSAGLCDTEARVRRAAFQLLAQVATECTPSKVGAAVAVLVPVPLAVAQPGVTAQGGSPGAGSASGDLAASGPAAPTSACGEDPALATVEAKTLETVRRAAAAALEEATPATEPSSLLGRMGWASLVLLSNGSRGDLQPLTVLAGHLRARGCALLALTRSNLVGFCKERSLDAKPAFPDLEYMFRRVGGVSDESMHRLGEAEAQWKREHPAALVDPEAAIREFGPDAVLWSLGGCEAIAWSCMESMGVPAIGVLGSGLRSAIASHGRSTPRCPAHPWFVTTSAFLEDDVDPGAVPDGLRQSGAWLPEEDPTPEKLAEEPLASLVAFLDAGPPPIAVGWGSLLADGLKPEVMLLQAVMAARSAGQRLVVIGGWARLHELGAAVVRGDLVPQDWVACEGQSDQIVEFACRDCCFVASAPHCWLFPRCACVVHHGGAGTTHAVLSMGRPCVITPIAWDQFEWARTVQRLGVGVGFQEHLSKLTIAQLSSAVQKALGMAEKARRLGEQMRQEPGVEVAAEAICSFLKHAVKSGGWKLRREASRSSAA